jgi:hypothetical protein
MFSLRMSVSPLSRTFFRVIFRLAVRSAIPSRSVRGGSFICESSFANLCRSADSLSVAPHSAASVRGSFSFFGGSSPPVFRRMISPRGESDVTIFGETPIDAAELVKELIARVRPQVTRQSTDLEWTKAVKQSLRLLGNECGKVVAPDTIDEQAEFMLDLIWWRDKHSNDIDLAVECDWGNKKTVEYDFGKLLSIKAPLKLMVYGPSTHEKRGLPIREGIEKHYMEKFSQHVAGERYLLVEVDVPKNLVFAYEILVSEHGSIQKPEFKQFLKTSFWSGEAAAH